MAERRMFSKTLIDSDAFLDMPLSAQALYFHLCMRADDDGFINNSQKIIRMINASKNDYDLLIVKQFIIQFDDGICVIRHWRIHNYIRPDRYKSTMYQEDKRFLVIQENKSYTIDEEIINKQNNNGIPSDTLLPPQDSIGKDKLDKVSKGKSKNKRRNIRQEKGNKAESKAEDDVIQLIINKWNSLQLTRIMSIKNTRLKFINARIKDYGIDKVLETIDSISNSKFLQGVNERNWTITFDWFIKSSNFTKVLEGNYLDKDYIKNSEEQKSNNFTARNYDYDSLEKKLLGWDKSK